MADAQRQQRLGLLLLVPTKFSDSEAGEGNATAFPGQPKPSRSTSARSRSARRCSDRTIQIRKLYAGTSTCCDNLRCLPAEGRTPSATNKSNDHGLAHQTTGCQRPIHGSPRGKFPPRFSRVVSRRLFLSASLINRKEKRWYADQHVRVIGRPDRLTSNARSKPRAPKAPLTRGVRERCTEYTAWREVQLARLRDWFRQNREASKTLR